MSDKIMGAHQPNFLPYLGFFDKMERCDIFVIRDEVLFVKKEYHNRNRIRINGNDNMNKPQCKWIHVPVHHKDDYIKHIEINHKSKKRNITWNKEVIHEIKTHYEKTEHFKKTFPKIEKIFLEKNETLLELNMKIINFLKKEFEIETKIILASELGLKPEHYTKSDASQDLANISKAVGANIYISGDGGKVYLNREPFKKEDIEVIFQEYHHPVYPQRYPSFMPYMSAIDALFCIGRMPKIEGIPQLECPAVGE